MDEYATKLSGSYNRAHAGQFGRRGAVKTILGPWNLQITKLPPPEFGNNTDRLTKDSEFSLFCALHFLRYRITKSKDKRALDGYMQIYLALRNRAISANWKLVPSAVARASRGFYDPDALVVEGNRGLIDAVDKFDPWRGYKFSTYACNAIHRRMWREMKRRIYTSTEIIPELSTDRPDEAEALWLEQLILLLNGKNYLNGQERDVLQFRFRDNMTLEQAGNTMGVTKERVRQIQLKLIWKIKRSLNQIPVLNENAIQYGVLQKELSRLSA